MTETTIAIAEEAITAGAQQKLSEFGKLLEMLPLKAGNKMIEIGSYHGGTLNAWAKLFDTVIAIDPEHGSQIEGVTYISGKSEDVFPEVRKALGSNFTKVDFLFIDGSHAYEDVKKDFEMYAPLVKKGGIIALHDIVDSPMHRELGCEVSRFWNDLKVSGPFITTEFIEGDDWGGIGVIIQP